MTNNGKNLSDKRIKVLFTFGGMPHYLKALLRNIQRKGIDIVVALPDKGKGRSIGAGVYIPDEEYDFKVFYLKECTGWYGKPFLKGLKNLIVQERPDILVFIWPYILQIVFDPFLYKTLRKLDVSILLREIPFQVPPKGEIAGYFRRNPYMTESGTYLKHPGILFIIRQYMLSFVRQTYYARVTGVLHYAEGNENIPVSYGVPPDRIWPTFNSPDTTALLEAYEILKETENITKNGRKIIHIGRLVPWKKTDLLIRAVSVLIKDIPDINLVIVGDGPQRKELENLAKELGVAANVQFAGAVYKPLELGKYLMEADVYVLAGMGGLSINEAMAFGKPVICSVCDGTEKDLVLDSINGYFFRPDDVYDLADKIRQLILHPERIKKMGEASQKIIREKININTVSDRFVEAFRKVTAIKSSMEEK